MIKVEKLIKNYGDFEAVKSIDFSIDHGEVVGFLGSNGAGKSTTLKILTGYLTPTSGNVLINNLNIETHAHEIKKIVGYLPESNPLYHDMFVYDLLKFTANTRQIFNNDFKNAFEKVIAQCGLKDVIHKKVGECSKGYKQRVGLACAMIHDPKILILDEPVTGLDPNQIIEIRGLIKSLGKEKLVFMSSHILQEIQATVDRIIIINHGEIVANGTNEELMTSFMGNVLLTMEVKGAKVDSIKHIQASLPSVKYVSSSKEKSIHTIQYEYDKNKDSREEIFKYAVKNKWSILKMSPKTTDLEDIFRNLTMEGGVSA